LSRYLARGSQSAASASLRPSASLQFSARGRPAHSLRPHTVCGRTQSAAHSLPQTVAARSRAAERAQSGKVRRRKFARGNEQDSGNPARRKCGKTEGGPPLPSSTVCPSVWRSGGANPAPRLSLAETARPLGFGLGAGGPLEPAPNSSGAYRSARVEGGHFLSASGGALCRLGAARGCLGLLEARLAELIGGWPASWGEQQAASDELLAGACSVRLLYTQSAPPLQTVCGPHTVFSPFGRGAARRVCELADLPAASATHRRPADDQ